MAVVVGEERWCVNYTKTERLIKNFRTKRCAFRRAYTSAELAAECQKRSLGVQLCNLLTYKKALNMCESCKDYLGEMPSADELEILSL